MIVTRWMYPELAAHEDAVNSGWPTAGPEVRLCFHVDRTVTFEKGMVRAECDYCPAVGLDRQRLPDMIPFVLQEGS
jgi:hypothetical protein